MNRIFLAVACVAIPGVSSAQVFSELEPNGTFATANVVTAPASVPYALTADPTLTANDIDYFRIGLVANTVLSVVATPLVNDFTPNTILGLFDSTSTHTLLRFNDDFGGTSASAFTYRVTTPGDYFIGVTGFGETAANGGFTGSHSQVGGYQLTISVSPAPVPEPGSLAALGLGLFVPILRRRRTAIGAKNR